MRHAGSQDTEIAVTVTPDPQQLNQVTITMADGATMQMVTVYQYVDDQTFTKLYSGSIRK